MYLIWHSQHLSLKCFNFFTHLNIWFNVFVLFHFVPFHLPFHTMIWGTFEVSKRTRWYKFSLASLFICLFVLFLDIITLPHIVHLDGLFAVFLLLCIFEWFLYMNFFPHIAQEFRCFLAWLFIWLFKWKFVWFVVWCVVFQYIFHAPLPVTFFTYFLFRQVCVVALITIKILKISVSLGSFGSFTFYKNTWFFSVASCFLSEKESSILIFSTSKVKIESQKFWFYFLISQYFQHTQQVLFPLLTQGQTVSLPSQLLQTCHQSQQLHWLPLSFPSPVSGAGPPPGALVASANCLWGTVLRY